MAKKAALIAFVIAGAGLAAQRGSIVTPDAKAAAFAKPAADNMTLTAVEGIKVGHHTLTERPTGCTAIVFKEGTTGGVDQRGGAPGTRETDVLNPVNDVQIINAVSLSGGARSASTPRAAS